MDFVVPALVPLLLAAVGAVRRAPVPPPVVSWSALVEAPERHVGTPVRLFLQQHSAVPTWEPFLTRFAPERYVALQGWSDEQILWDETSYDAPQMRVFVPRGGRLERLAARLRPHERLALVGVVRSAHLGRPWFEVLGFQRTRESVPEGTVLHAVKALELMERAAWSLAREQLDRALLAPLTEPARASIVALREHCDERLAPRRARNASAERDGER